MWNVTGYDWNPIGVDGILANLERGIARNQRRGRSSNLLLHDGGHRGDGCGAHGYGASGGPAAGGARGDGDAICDGGCVGRFVTRFGLRAVLSMVAARFRADQREGCAKRLTAWERLGGEEFAFALDAPAIAGEAAVLADDAVAGDGDGDGVGANGGGDGAGRGGLAELAGESE